MQGWFQKYFFWIALFFFLSSLSFFYWAKSVRDLRVKEKQIVTYFKDFKKLDDKIFISDIPFLDPIGEERTFRDYRGKYLVVNVWATWCAPCVKELPSLKKLRLRLHAMRAPWEVMAISIDTKDNLEKIINFIDRYDLGTFAFYYDHKNKIQDNLNIVKLPTTFIVSDTGRIVYVIQGEAFWQDQDIFDFLLYFQNVY